MIIQASSRLVEQRCSRHMWVITMIHSRAGPAHSHQKHCDPQQMLTWSNRGAVGSQRILERVLNTLSRYGYNILINTYLVKQRCSRHVGIMLGGCAGPLNCDALATGIRAGPYDRRGASDAGRPLALLASCVQCTLYVCGRVLRCSTSGSTSSRDVYKEVQGDQSAGNTPAAA
jgi:hypothetical protein